jgi:hypothetical protein
LNVCEVLTAEDITGIQRLDKTRNIHWRAVPSLQNLDLTEDELMDSLGMIRESNEEYEPFDCFISRTEVS